MSVEIGKKSINAQVNQITAKAKQTSVLVTTIDLLDKSGGVDVPIAVMDQVANKVIAKCPDVALLLLTAGKNRCQMHASTPSETFSALDWINACEPTDSEFGNDRTAHGELACPPPESALKQCDQLRQHAFAFLRANGHMPGEDESSSEEFGCHFDINA